MSIKKFDPNEFVFQLKRSFKEKRPVVVAGVGSGITAKSASTGGADAVAVYSTAAYRIRGLPTALAFLPYDDTNALTFSILPEILAVVKDTPVIAGFGAHDPRAPIDVLLDKAEALGVIGVTNEPFIGIYGKDLKAQLDASGLGFSRELQLIKCAGERKMLALGWAFTPEEARLMVDAGAQIIGAMIGVTAGGQAGGKRITSLDEAAESIAEIVTAAKGINDDVIVLGHGGPLNNPSAVKRILERSGAHGYVTGSTGERIPIEISVSDTIKQYKGLKIRSN